MHGAISRFRDITYETCLCIFICIGPYKNKICNDIF